ncbi:hypothetical protein CBL_10405 [Carabus blaptoides fortunei]
MASLGKWEDQWWCKVRCYILYEEFSITRENLARTPYLFAEISYRLVISVRKKCTNFVSSAIEDGHFIGLVATCENVVLEGQMAVMCQRITDYAASKQTLVTRCWKDIMASSKSVFCAFFQLEVQRDRVVRTERDETRSADLYPVEFESNLWSDEINGLKCVAYGSCSTVPDWTGYQILGIHFHRGDGGVKVRLGKASRRLTESSDMDRATVGQATPL